MAIKRPTALTAQQDKQRSAAIRQAQIESNAGMKSKVSEKLVGAKPGVITRSGNTLFKDGRLVGNYNSKDAADAAFSSFTSTGSNVAGDTGGKTYRYIQQFGVGDKMNPSTPYYGQFQSPTASPARTPFRVNALNAGVSGNQMQGSPYDTSGGGLSYNRGALGSINMSEPSTSDSSYLSSAPEKPKTLAEIRADQLAQAQASIDATQAVFEDTLRSIRQTGASQLAQTSSNNVSAGLAGSPFAQTNETGVQNYTQEQLNARANQRAADISSIRQTAEANAQNIYQQGIQNYQADRTFYASERDKQLEAQKALADADKKSATDTLSTLAKSGYSIDEMQPEEYKALLAKAGMSDFEARAIWAASSPKANAKYEIQNGFIVGTYFDPHTGLPVVTTTALPDSLKDAVSPDIKSLTLADGSVVLYDASKPYKADGKTLNTIDYSGSDIRETETMDTPSSYDEWVLAGGLDGTGKTYSEFISDDSTSTEKPLSATDRKAQAIVTSGLDSIKTLEGLLTTNQGIFGRPLISSGTYKAAEENLVDVIGRLRSGGAVTIDEEAKFLRLLPGRFETQKTVEFKLKQMRDFLEEASITQGGSSGLSDEERQYIIDEGGDPDALDFSSVSGDTNEAADITGALNTFKGNVLGKIQPENTVSEVALGNKIVKVNTAVANRLAMADKEYFAATGKHIPVSESFRDAERQKELFKKLSAKGARVAPQGYSFHELGMAVDVGDSWKEVKPYLNKYGFINGLANDMGHFSVGELS